MIDMPTIQLVGCSMIANASDPRPVNASVARAEASVA